MIIFGALIVLIAQLTTNMAANVVSPANDFSSLAPRRISYVAGGLITACIGIVMMPWKLYADAAAYIFTWLVGYSSLMGAIGGILIADYWIMRGRSLELPDLFKPNGRYSLHQRRQLARDRGARRSRSCRSSPDFSGPPPPLEAWSRIRRFLDVIYTYAWFVTFVLSGVGPGVTSTRWMETGIGDSRAHRNRRIEVGGEGDRLVDGLVRSPSRWIG